MTAGEAIERARDAAKSPQGAALLDAADELLELARAVARMRHAQQHYWRISKRSSEAQRLAALQASKLVEGEVDERLARLGLGPQQLLPGSDLEPPGYVR